MLKPHPRFDCHFQDDGLPISAHFKILVAVSGGSDSMALIHLLNDWRITSKAKVTIDTATVDHGLRAEASDEARMVETKCRSLGLNHTTLRWNRKAKDRATAEAAREKRYELLCDHARMSGATCLVLGHTIDDQAETVVMRAARSGGTRGLSGMSRCSHYASPTWRIALFRPLLGTKRQELRTYLRDRNVSWIDDPSNENPNAERVQVRQRLATDPHLPSAEQIARFATLCGRLRAMRSRQTANFLKANGYEAKDGGFALNKPIQCQDSAVIAEAFSILILASGNKTWRVAPHRLSRLVTSYTKGERQRMAFGGALITTGKMGANFTRELRNGNAKTHAETSVPQMLNADGQRYFAGLERFLPATDYPLLRALKTLPCEG